MSRYRKSWTEALKEIRGNVPVNKDIDEAVLVDRDYKYDGKVIHISKKNFKKVHKDFKNDTPGKERMITYDDKAGTVSVPVKFTESKQHIDWHYGHEPQGGHDHYEDIEESAALQLKMAFDDAGIKIKGVKGGKLVIAKKDEKKVEKIIAKQMKKPSDAKRILGSQIIFEEIELSEKEVALPSSIENLKQIVKDKQNAVFMFKDGKIRVDLFSASALVQVYDALKPATKKKFEDMIKTKGGFVASVDFAFKMAKK